MFSQHSSFNNILTVWYNLFIYCQPQQCNTTHYTQQISVFCRRKNTLIYYTASDANKELVSRMYFVIHAFQIRIEYSRSCTSAQDHKFISIFQKPTNYKDFQRIKAFQSNNWAESHWGQILNLTLSDLDYYYSCCCCFSSCWLERAKFVVFAKIFTQRWESVWLLSIFDKLLGLVWNLPCILYATNEDIQANFFSVVNKNISANPAVNAWQLNYLFKCLS